MTKTIEVDYKNMGNCWSLGKRAADQMGLIFSIEIGSPDRVKIEAKNKKLKRATTSLMMQFPVEEIDNIIKALKQIKNGDIS